MGKLFILKVMAEGIHDPPLPNVNQDDIDHAELISLLGPSLQEQWQDFARQEPTLARDVLTRAHLLFPTEQVSRVEARQAVANYTVFMAKVFGFTALRHPEDFSDDVVDVNQPPEVVPGDGQ